MQRWLKCNLQLQSIPNRIGCEALNPICASAAIAGWQIAKEYFVNWLSVIFFSERSR